MSTFTRVGPRLGALLTLATASAATAAVTGLAAPAVASPGAEPRTAATLYATARDAAAQYAAAPRTAMEHTVVQTHTWVQAPGSSLASTTTPAGTWIDGVHGPVLDGALISTPLLVVMLACVAISALVMAVRAARAVSTDAPSNAGTVGQSAPGPSTSTHSIAAGVR